ncbi:PREDICTED: phosphate transporter PHO1 homolog 1-like [Amphimedon queenslandica]|uniref:EXS domain-containing protein n=1 Tax=Amphimedon queenslandica TaxID=400682 RepID=A0A1X7V1A6_AMPQE|nr:PREDICTED: phosphate transporter PHO1 homolog 1-like [Amphimedon queenslandica]|eukprot:XP_011403470.1 PREDICTED: phosphate transporter PHO1 homolog 1-like [Amphimedon queenslandica]
MGDILVSINWPEDEQGTREGSPLLSFQRTHARRVSYGSYLPRYSLDQGYLQRLLSSSLPPTLPSSTTPTPVCEEPATKGSREFARPFYSRPSEEAVQRKKEAGLPEEATPLRPQTLQFKHSSSCSAGASLLKEEEEAKPLLSPKETKLEVPPSLRRHCHHDSLIDSPSPVFDSEALVFECERQLIGLLDYIETHLKQVNDDLIQQQHRLSMNVHESLVPISSINTGEDPEDKSSLKSGSSNSLPSDTTSIGGDSGIEDDHLTTPKGFLSRMKEVVESLVNSLNTTVKQLDEMVGMYDERSNGNLGRSTLSRHLERRNSLQKQLKDSLKKIDKELDDFYEKERNSVKITSALNQAKKESLGCTGFLTLILLLSTIGIMSFLGGYYPNQRWVVVLRLIRSPLIINLFLFLIGFNILAWSRHNIDYVRIFDFPLDAIPTPRLIFNIAGIFTILFSLLSSVCFITNDDSYLYIIDKVVATLMWLTLLLFLINPFKVLYRSGRLSLIFVFVRIMMAPLPVVKFGDFWLADQLNSMVPLLLDVQYFICYSSLSISWTDELKLKSCTMSPIGIRAIISCLPALWRFWQTIRCYQKTRKVAHLINAGKYFTTFPVVIFAFIFSIEVKSRSWNSLTFSQVGWIIILWCISSVIHSLYTFYWDIRMDWGLLCISKGTLLRPTLYYPKFVYVFAIIFDFVIRFACAIKLTLAIVYHNDSDVIYFALIIAELLRRWVWNFFRIEYEDILSRRRHMY